MFNLSSRFQELRSTIIGIVVLSASIIMGIVWIGIGLSHWLTDCLGSVWGPIVLGLICFVPVVIFALLKAFSRNDTRAPTANAQSEYGDAAAANMANMFASLSGHSPFLGVAAAVVMSFVITRFPAIAPLFSQLLFAYNQDVKARAAKTAAGQGEASGSSDSTTST